MGMIIMLLPPFAAVKYDELFVSLRSIPKRLAFGSVLVNWAMLGTGLVRFSTWVFGKGKTWDLGDFKVTMSVLKLEVSEFFLVKKTRKDWQLRDFGKANVEGHWYWVIISFMRRFKFQLIWFWRELIRFWGWTSTDFLVVAWSDTDLASNLKERTQKPFNVFFC